MYTPLGVVLRMQVRRASDLSPVFNFLFETIIMCSQSHHCPKILIRFTATSSRLLEIPQQDVVRTLLPTHQPFKKWERLLTSKDPNFPRLLVPLAQEGAAGGLKEAEGNNKDGKEDHLEVDKQEQEQEQEKEMKRNTNSSV